MNGGELLSGDTFKGLIIFAALIFLFVAERYLFPYGALARINNKKHLAHNFGLAFLTIILSRWWVVPVSVFAYKLAPEPVLLNNWLPMWGVFIVHFLVLDMWLYWWHRLNHTVPFLWRFHAVHHRDDALDVTTAFRFHVGEVFLSALPRGLIIFSLGIPLSHILLYEGFVALHSAFHHANISLPKKLEPLMRPIFITPTMHWVHHNPQREDTDSNYGATVSLWDMLFKSYNTKPAPPEQPMGIDGFTDKETTFSGLLFQPFKNQAMLYKNKNKKPTL